MNHAAAPVARERGRGADLFDGLATFSAVVLASLAFDDITTDTATSFEAEYACLLLCAGWMALLTGRLAWRGRRVLASVCAALLLGILWGWRQIGPGTRASWQPEYVVATAALAGMFLVSCALVPRARRLTWSSPSLR